MEEDNVDRLEVIDNVVIDGEEGFNHDEDNSQAVKEC